MSQPEVSARMGASGEGIVEVRPRPDDDQMDIIHGLGIRGVSSIVEVDDRQGSATNFVFQRADPVQLDGIAHSIRDSIC